MAIFIFLNLELDSNILTIYLSSLNLTMFLFISTNSNYKKSFYIKNTFFLWIRPFDPNFEKFLNYIALVLDKLYK